MSWRKYFAFFVIGFKRELDNRSLVFGRILFYGVILLIFNKIWQFALQVPTTKITSATDMLWYIALTEWIVLSVPAIQIEMENDIKSGDVVYQMVRPTSYPLIKISEAFGMLV